MFETNKVKSFSCFLKAVKNVIEEPNLIENELQRYAFGTDASFYRLTPQLVIKINNEEQLIKIIKLSNQYLIPITFRAAGTSLSGQAITDSVLIILSQQWNKITVLEKGIKVKLQPGVIGSHANRALANYDRKIGPDPASINSCKIGGIAANNSSGMCCGVKHNSYHTLADIRIVIPNGDVLDTANLLSREQFVRNNPALITEIVALADKIKSDSSLSHKIAHKYRLKNTMGYGVNALLEYSDPIDIISHLMIGSEGTLGFIADITYKTIVIEPFTAVALLVFNDIKITCELVQKLAQEKVSAIELMDGTALNSVSEKLSDFVSIDQLSHRHAGLLIEISANTLNELKNKQALVQQHINECGDYLIATQAFTQEKIDIEKLWAIRKGMFPAVGAQRALGTTVIIEDVALPLADLASGVEKLQQLFQQYGYFEAIIFGHALDGNLHFVFTQSFDDEAEIQRYSQFMRSVSELIAIDFQGSLKAEHGTGRNMAPFVEMEWGESIYQVMQSIKKAFDPLNVFNPGVIINDNANVHLLDLKTLPQSHDIIDKCIECGFCESVCPSKEYTLTPRQRIAVWRHIKHLKAQNKQGLLSVEEQADYQKLQKDYQFYGVDSCAATGLCAHECPVDIDTGQFILSLREQNKNNQWLMSQTADHFSKVVWGANKAIKVITKTSQLIGQNKTKTLFQWLNKISRNKIPLWYASWPSGADNSVIIPPKAIELSASHGINKGQPKKVVFMSSCTNRIFATDSNAADKRPLLTVFASILAKANIELIIPKSVESLCCGKPWLSQGNKLIADQKAQEFVDVITDASEGGRWPVVVDTSPCALTLHQLKGSNVMELSEYLLTSVVPNLAITKTSEPIMLHQTCSSIQRDGAMALRTLTQLCCCNVIIPNDIYCCGFAGGKGFYLPQLNKSALAPLAAQIPAGCQRGVSNSRTCEIGLTEHSKLPYQSIIYLLDEVSRPL